MIPRRQVLHLLGAGVVGAMLAPRSGRAARLGTRDVVAGRLLTRALDDPSFWEGSAVKAFQGRLYDEVRLKELDEGFLAMVTGEGGRDFAPETVVRTVFESMERLPTVEDGAKAVVRLGRGTDAATGLPYVDSFYYLDFTLFYGTYAQRMYKVQDGERTILYFEKLSPELAGDAWPAYQAHMEQVSQGVKRRVLFNAVNPVSEIFGMFVVSPGRAHRSRVSFTTRIRFGDDSGAIARMGSDMPVVIRSGLESGFESCVAIAGQLEPTAGQQGPTAGQSDPAAGG